MRKPFIGKLYCMIQLKVFWFLISNLQDLFNNLKMALFRHCLQFNVCHKNLEHHETPNPKMKKPLGNDGTHFPTLACSNVFEA